MSTRYVWGRYTVGGGRTNYGGNFTTASSDWYCRMDNDTDSAAQGNTMYIGTSYTTNPDGTFNITGQTSEVYIRDSAGISRWTYINEFSSTVSTACDETGEKSGVHYYIPNIEPYTICFSFEGFNSVNCIYYFSGSMCLNDTTSISLRAQVSTYKVFSTPENNEFDSSMWSNEQQQQVYTSFHIVKNRAPYKNALNGTVSNAASSTYPLKYTYYLVSIICSFLASSARRCVDV